MRTLDDFDMTADPPPPPQNSYPATPKSLGDLDIADELMNQYERAVALYEDIQHDERVQANQKSQVLNSVSSILAQVTKLQTELYTSERLKQIELTLLSVLKTQPKEFQDKFVLEYEQALKVLT